MFGSRRGITLLASTHIDCVGSMMTKSGTLQSQQLRSAHTLTRGVYHTSDGDVTTSIPDEHAARPLVICLGWTGGKVRQLKKYSELFSRHADTDSLILESHAHMIYNPSSGKAAMTELASALRAPELRDRPLIIAGFSIGAYLFGILQNVLREEYPSDDHVNGRIRCLVLDSPVDYWGVPMGLSRAMAGGKTGTPLQKFLKNTIELYLATFTSVTAQYLESSNAFHGYDTRVPSLWLLSEGDVVSDPKRIRLVHQKWERRNPGTVTEVEFDDSQHVLHLRKHPQDYESAIQKHFLHVRNADPAQYESALEEFLKTARPLEDAVERSDWAK